MINTFKLEQNYPNPFNASTSITYQLPQKSHLNIAVYNIAGQKVKELFHGEKTAGKHTFNWDGTNYASGIYFVKIKSDAFMDIIKCILIK